MSYTAQEEMCNELAEQLREELITKYDLSCIHIYHSLGILKLEHFAFCFSSGRHRSNTFHALEECVNKVKSNLPIFGKRYMMINLMVGNQIHKIW